MRRRIYFDYYGGRRVETTREMIYRRYGWLVHDLLPATIIGIMSAFCFALLG